VSRKKNRRTTTRPSSSARAKERISLRRIPGEIVIILLLILAVGLAGGLWYFVLQPQTIAGSDTATGASIAAGTGGTSQPVAESSPAPDFTTTDLDGNAVSLSDYRGSPVVLNAWATWCGPCRMEMPDLEKLYQEYKDQDVIVLAVNMGEPQNRVAGFIKDGGYTFPVLLDESMSAVGRPYRISSIPATFFIDREGKLASIRVGAMNLAEMERRLAEIL
jgi:peroxiredoxin